MNIVRLSFRKMTSRPLNTALSLLLLSMGVGMISLLLQVNSHFQQQMQANVRGINMVVGAKGSPLQLILSAVYHIDAPTGNISMREAFKLKNNALVEYGIPLSYGDSYKGFRIVGSTHEYPELYDVSVSEGRLWNKPFEVTIGASVSGKLGLDIGDEFIGQHGLTHQGADHDEFPYRVVGIMGNSNSVMDQLILTATESVWAVHHHVQNDQSTAAASDHDHNHHHDHDHVHGTELQDEDREITALLVKFRNPIGMIQLPRMVNEQTNLQAAVPVYELHRLFKLTGVGIDMFSAIAFILIIVSGLSLFISLLNAMKSRQYEMALMRTYGASRMQLVWLVVQEALLLSIAGYLLGIVFSRLGLFFVSKLIIDNYHYSFASWNWLMEETWLLLITIAIGLLAALIPAIRVYRIRISKTLANA